MDRASVSTEVIEKLRQYSTPTVSNVIELFDLRPSDEGFLTGEIRALTSAAERPSVGFAVTATVRTSTVPHTDERETPLEQHLRRLQEVEWPRIVVFQDLDVPPRAATFGECMAAAYTAMGCVAVISSGFVRDIDELERRQFPVYARGMVASHGLFRLIEVMGPIEVGNARISSGTLLHGDRNGVVIVPREIAHWVAAGCEDFVRLEAEFQRQFDSHGRAVDAERVFRMLQERKEALRTRLVNLWRRRRYPDLSRPVLDW
ncbi:MAG: RraA family protein [candidate division KSB1 bacterium]|nr:RraA family protein [candidate division KSB1 bacterium]